MPDVYSAGGTPVTPVPTAAAAPTKTLSDMSDPQARREMIQRILRQVGEVPRRACYGAYVVSPDRRFTNEQSDEEVVLLLRSHPITNGRWIIATLVMLAVPQVILFSGMLSWAPRQFLLVGEVFIYLIALGFAFENFLRWYYSVLIVTNERVVDIDFTGILSLRMTHAELNKIEEKSLVQSGLLRSLFQFGTVDISTAAEVQDVEIIDVPFPEKVLRVIDELSEELEKRRERGE